MTKEKMRVTCAGITFLGPESEQGELGYRKKLGPGCWDY